MGAAGLSNEAILTLAPEASQHTIATAYFHDSLDAETKDWSERYMVMFKGAARGTRKDVRDDPRMRDAYLGG
jgi:ABC-type branched-subunit amino acid transport system ATPase component